MEFSIRMLVVLVMALIVFVIVVFMAGGLSGESIDLIKWFTDSLKGSTGLDFGGSK